MYYYNPMIPYFAEAQIRAAAVSIDGEVGEYTYDYFVEDFPEFFSKTTENDETTYTPLLPTETLDRYIASANVSILPSRWGDDWRMAAGLFVAHMCALRLQTYADGSTASATAANSANVGTLKTATMGDTSLSYDNTATNSGTEKWGTWNLTKYGSQLATMARMLGISGMYVI